MSGNKLLDTIIFSTAKIHGLNLISANEDDFKGITGIVKVINPFYK